MATGRYAFLDFYRGIIILLMIQGHVARELLEPALRQTPFFGFHEVLHGVTGPGFLFGAGITFGIAAQRRWTHYLSWTPVLRKRLGRIALLITLGYMLHLPFFSLRKTLAETSPESWSSFLSFDVLQCIGFSLLILQLMLLLIRSERFFVSSVLLLMVGVISGAPLVWSFERMNELPQVVSMALQGTTGSTYPLFPYSAFLFAGTFASYEFTKFAERGMQGTFIRRLALAGILLPLAGIGLEALPVSIYHEVDFWQNSPTFFLIQLGCLFLLVAGTWFLVEKAFSKVLLDKLHWVTIAGKESLFIYLLHLIILYGWITNPNASLSFLWADQLTWGPVLMVTLAFTASLTLLAWGWNAMKDEHQVLSRGIVWWLGTVFVYEFLTRPY